jgi:hypothetical protein
MSQNTAQPLNGKGQVHNDRKDGSQAWTRAVSGQNLGTDPGAILIYEPRVRITGEFLLMLNGLRDLTWSGDSDLIYEPAVRIIMESFVEYEGLATFEKWWNPDSIYEPVVV